MLLSDMASGTIYRIVLLAPLKMILYALVEFLLELSQEIKYRQQSTTA